MGVLVPFVAAGHEVVGLDVGWYDGSALRMTRLPAFFFPLLTGRFNPVTPYGQSS